MEMAAAFTIKAYVKQHKAHSPSTPRASGELLNKSRHFKAISMESIFCSSRECSGAFSGGATGGGGGGLGGKYSHFFENMVI